MVLRLIAERLLPEGLQGATFMQGEVIQQRFALPVLAGGCRYHLFVSERNAGAAALVAELERTRRLVLATTSDPAQLRHCAAFLLHLTRKTWTSGESSAALAHQVLEAMDAGVELLLTHEMPGLGSNEERDACRFELFFACDDGTTPDELLARGVYRSVALALKGGPLRLVSMALIHQAIANLGQPGARWRPKWSRLLSSWSESSWSRLSWSEASWPSLTESSGLSSSSRGWRTRIQPPLDGAPRHLPRTLSPLRIPGALVRQLSGMSRYQPTSGREDEADARVVTFTEMVEQPSEHAFGGTSEADGRAAGNA
jgi:hypothetical protein